MKKEDKIEVRGDYIYENGMQVARLNREKGTVTFYCGDSYYDYPITIRELELALSALKEEKENSNESL